MWINVHGKGFAIDEGVLGYIERRLRFALGRFGDLIGRVTVLIDADGPRAEHEKLCRVVVDLLGHARIVVEDTDSSLNAAIDRAADRVGQAVHRKLDRVRLYAALNGPRPAGWN